MMAWIHLAIAFLGGAYAFAVLVQNLFHRRANRQNKSSLKELFPPSQRSKLDSTRDDDVDLSQSLRHHVLGLEADYRLADPSTFLFSGFTVAEVRSLGHFPDYAKLSGVPLPSPLTDFTVQDALPRPYRPFRWPYHQTMALQKLDTDYWLELESSYLDRIRQRKALYAQHGESIMKALPGSELAQKELMEMVVQFLCARYPRQFELLPPGPTLVNHLLGTEQSLQQVEPLSFLLNNVPEDFAIMLRDDETGRYLFRAGVICSAVGWHLGEKMGRSLSEIHQPVPDYKEKIGLSVDRFFAKLSTSNPIQRASWGLEMGQPLFLPRTHPDFEQRTTTQDAGLGPDQVFLRVDWQTLRRLPLSGAVVFNFKALFTPMTEFRDEPYIPSLLLKILDCAEEDIMRYKGTWHVEHVVRPTLKAYERSQMERRLMEENWHPRTLAENPFFPGWETKYGSRKK